MQIIDAFNYNFQFKDIYLYSIRGFGASDDGVILFFGTNLSKLLPV